MFATAPESSRAIFRFGAFVYHPTTMELVKAGTAVRLQRQPAQVLELPLARAGQLVTRDAIRQSLWSDGTTVDFELGVNRCVRQLRAALLDDIEAPRYIKTVPRLGYCFVAPVSIAGSEAPARISAAYPLPVPSNEEQHPSIVVLPFVNLTNVPEDEYFSDGLTEETINALVQIPGLKVIARTSAFAFKGKAEDIRRIAETLGVTTALEGSVRRAGTRVRVTVQLIRAHDGTHLFSDRYDREMNDVFAIQDEIASDVAHRLKLQLAMHKRTAPKPAAYRAFLEGRFHWYKLTREGFAKSLECYQRAVSIDPNCGLGHAGMAHYYFGLAMDGIVEPLDALPKVQAYAQRAIELDESSGNGQGALGCAAGMLHYDWACADHHFQRSRVLGHSSLDRLGYAVWYLLPQCRIEEALRECDEVLEQDPLLLLAGASKTLLLLCARNYEAAAEECERVLNIDPAFPKAVQQLVHIRGLQNRHTEALRWAHQALQLGGDSLLSLAVLGAAHAAAGHMDDARAVLRRLGSAPAGPRLCACGIAQIHTLLGEKDAAFEWLERATDLRDPWTLWLKSIPWADTLRSDPRYLKLLSKMNLAGPVDEGR